MSADAMSSLSSAQPEALPSPDAESQLPSPAVGSAAAFDYRDDETKAKFAAMMAGAGKKGRKSGEKKARAQPTANTAAAAASSSPSLPSSSSFSPSSPTAVAPLPASASFSPAVSVDPSLPETGVMGAESPSARSKRRQRTPKAAEQSSGAAAQEAGPDAAPSSLPSSSAASVASSSSVTASAMAALARASPARSGRAPAAVTDKPRGRAASALAALSSRLKNTMSSTAMPQSAASAAAGKEDGDGALPPQLTNGNGGYPAAGHSLLDPSPSSLASAFSSPVPSTPASPRQKPAAAAWKGRKEEAVDDPAEDEDDSPVALSAPRDGEDEDDVEEEEEEAEEEEEEDEEEEETPTAAERIEHFESPDAVKGVIRREQLDAMEQDSKLQHTMPWHQQQQQQQQQETASSSSSSSSSTGNGRRPPKTKERKSSSRLSPTSPSTPSSSSSPKVTQVTAQAGGDRASPAPHYGSLVPSPEAPSTPNEEGDSPLTVANDYDHHYSLPPSAAPIASAAPTAASAAQTAAAASPRPQHPSSPPPHPHHPYLPFTPSPAYFSTPMLPDLTSHGQHIKLILYAIRRQKRRTLLPLQSHQCPQCGLQLRNRIFSRPRYCNYTGLYYCRQCHVKERAVIPGRVLWYGDVKRYKVCRLVFQYLESIVGVPVLPMSAINPSLYRASKRLRYAFLLRQQLVYLRPFIETCAHRDELLVLFGDRVYMLNDTPVLSTSSRGLQTSFLDIVSSSEQAAAEPAQDPSHSARDMYSMRDLLEIVKGQLTEKLSLLVSTLISHVVHSECEDCGSKGAHCEGDGCDDRVPIYSFQVGSVIGCETCGCLFHRRCWNGDGVCPHCRRYADVQDSVVAAHRVANQVREGMADSRGAAWSVAGSVAADAGTGRRDYDDDSVVQY